MAAAAPELAGHVRAVAFVDESGRLDVAPDAPAYGTKARWITPKLIAAANSARHERPDPARAGTRLPRRHHGDVPAAPDEPAPQPVVPVGPVKTRQTASADYFSALEAHHAVAPPR
ncbi:hypothetical protein [Streptomyces sp. NK15101]|uniref:hypothetical protein n=1 Tax=Streptomyces sp. NK15101 TaxID=2873261 RepID=UPI001CEDD3DE|nr:hypothetical protein [Streptomyces sp. NK15101]